MKKTIIGIDPGKQGGIAFLTENNSNAVKMPQTVRELNTYLKYLKETYPNPIIFIEKVQAYRGKSIEEYKNEFYKIFDSQKQKEKIFEEFIKVITQGDEAPGKKFGINKMLANYNQLLTVIKLLEIPFVEVYPISWQTTLNLKIKNDRRTKTERKRSYKEFAQNRFPKVKLNLAIADSLCLVMFGEKKWEEDFNWIQERIQK